MQYYKNTSEQKHKNIEDDNEKELNKLYDELEEYIDDFEFINYITPLLEEKHPCDEKIYNLKKVLKYYKEEGVFLPLIDDPRYKFIKNYKDFEFTNCIAYEMAIRTDEFQKAKFLLQTIEDFNNMKSLHHLYYMSEEEEEDAFITEIKDSSQYLHKDIQKILLMNIDDKTSQNKIDKIITDLYREFEKSKLILKDYGILNFTSFLSQDMIDFTNGEFTLLDQIQGDLTLEDFNNGLNLLIKFYLPKGMIYKIDNDEIKFEKIIDNNVNGIENKILRDAKSHYISLESSLIQLSKDISVSKFDMEFQNFIKKHYNKYKYINTQPNYTRPGLHFLNARIINLPINLNFPEEELVSLVKKMKIDYDNKESLIKTPIEQLGEKLEKFIKPNSEKNLPTKDINKRKEAIATAFCVYDLDKVLTPIFNKRKLEYKKEKDDNPYTKEKLVSEISSILGSNIDEATVKIYRTLMKEYINKKRFIELITGVKSKE